MWNAECGVSNLIAVLKGKIFITKLRNIGTHHKHFVFFEFRAFVIDFL